MPPLPTVARLRRMLLLVPYVLNHSDPTVADVCARFGLTAEELADDLAVLVVCGLPPFTPGDMIEAWIEGDHVHIAVADYFARPPRLTRSEALASLLVGRAVAALPGLDEAGALTSALGKLERALAPDTAEAAHAAGRHVAIDLEGAAGEMLTTLRDATQVRERLRIVYYATSSDEITEREVDPWLVHYLDGNWYLVAFDHLRDDERMFRVDRIREAAGTGHTFELPAGFDPGRYLDGPVFAFSRDAERAVVELGPEAAWVRDAIPHAEATDLGDGRVRLEIATAHLAWLIRTLLAAGPAARPISPPALAEGLRGAAQRAIARYAQGLGFSI